MTHDVLVGLWKPPPSLRACGRCPMTWTDEQRKAAMTAGYAAWHKAGGEAAYGPPQWAAVVDAVLAAVSAAPEPEYQWGHRNRLGRLIAFPDEERARSAAKAELNPCEVVRWPIGPVEVVHGE